MNADGSAPLKIPTDPRYRLLQPAWSPDGKHLFARRWDGLYRISLDAPEGKTEERLVEELAQWPSPSRDGRFLYFYALRPIGDSNEIRGDLADGRTLRRLDLATGKAEDVPVAALPGGALAPQISPDGRRLAFARRVSGGHHHLARRYLCRPHRPPGARPGDGRRAGGDGPHRDRSHHGVRQPAAGSPSPPGTIPAAGTSGKLRWMAESRSASRAPRASTCTRSGASTAASS
ncbi:MAG TPA: hypothetical protein VKM72_12355 [Thermoanaerobaculia bacterium]|nr:hypothetical protein [Thermoanaerobaculia bacterium]